MMFSSKTLILAIAAMAMAVNAEPVVRSTSVVGADEILELTRFLMEDGNHTDHDDHDDEDHDDHGDCHCDGDEVHC
eukprot:CAMPEP_0201150056 /NCGR_PEP_ID=MMETSP0851-20130426/11266_1 /ASSEMBLY_ACC=CAM_ASM_000631 /TAXON_ID=183588 /ORGANISM="Pseudo-nitzschia fraudulenta, Strain WWA7" /LENGTH=75 /DNA_ID=CAMNT_0047426623 /DNA_START=67 /DNA_END=291 /DNA_ORIENTATION=+